LDLIDAYLTTARWVAVLHLAFFIACIVLWAGELRRVSRERKTYRKLWAKLKPSDASRQVLEKRAVSVAEGEAEISKLTATMLLMVQKGELPSAESIRARLFRSLAKHDPVVRACLNGFIISGLIGTLYNLWKLGPDFWAGLIQGNTGAGYPSIGIAFSASVFGLGYALFMMLFDTVFVRRRREALARDASAGLYDAAVILLPPTDSAAVADALNRFHDTSTGFLKEFKSRHEEIARQFTQQVQNSSDLLIGTLDDIGGRWESLTKSATEQISGASQALEAEVVVLTQATQTAQQSINKAVSSLQEVTRAIPALTELRANVEALLAEITDRLSGFDEQWRADLQQLSQTHAERLAESSRAGWDRYEKEAAEWHRKNAEALQAFSGSIETSISQWGEERRQVGALVDGLVDGWRRELGQVLTGMQSGLAQLREQVNGLGDASTRLTSVSNTNVQQLNALQNAVANISRNIVEGTPIGAAIGDMTRVVGELRDFLRDYKPSVVTVGGGGSPPPVLDLRELHSLLNEILSVLRARAFGPAPRDGQSADDGGSVRIDPASDRGSVSYSDASYRGKSFWRRVWPFRRKGSP
jgi:ABC-type transporter Mla subunit MlaD